MKPRRVPTKAELLDRLPRAFRRPLSPDQQSDLALCHIQNLDAIAKGDADAETLRQWAASVLTWWKVSQLLQIGVPEMQAQHDLAVSVIERYGRTARVGFSGQEYQLAKTGTVVMDELARIVDQPTASQAADWCEAQLTTTYQHLPMEQAA